MFLLTMICLSRVSFNTLNGYKQRMIDRTETTTIVPSAPKSNAARTAVPQSIMKLLKLEFGDKLTWDLDKDSDGWVIHLRSRKPNDDSR